VRALVFSPNSSRHSCTRASGVRSDFHNAKLRLNCRAGFAACSPCESHAAADETQSARVSTTATAASRT
jgi:hypothetical protein